MEQTLIGRIIPEEYITHLSFDDVAGHQLAMNEMSNRN